MPAAGGDATALSDVETLDLAGDSRIELRGPAGALLLNNARGTVELHEFDATGDHSVHMEGSRVVTGGAAAGASLVVSFSDASTAGDVAVLDGGQLRRLTDFSAPLRSIARHHRAGGADVPLGRRLPGPRLARAAGRARARIRCC